LKIGQYLAKIWGKICGLLFRPTCIFFFIHQNWQRSRKTKQNT